MNIDKVINILLVGIGGQGIILASEVLSQALFCSGYDVKKSEVHGMSQRGGSVRSEIRFGDKVYSPLIPDGCVDFLVVFNENELDRNAGCMNHAGMIIKIDESDSSFIPDAKVINLFLLGKLSVFLPVSQNKWISVISRMVPHNYLCDNLTAFNNGVQQGLKVNNGYSLTMFQN